MFIFGRPLWFSEYFLICFCRTSISPHISLFLTAASSRVAVPLFFSDFLSYWYSYCLTGAEDDAAQHSDQRGHWEGDHPRPNRMGEKSEESPGKIRFFLLWCIFEVLLIFIWLLCCVSRTIYHVACLVLSFSYFSCSTQSLLDRVSCGEIVFSLFHVCLL